MTQMVFKRYEIKYQLTDEQRSRLERLMQSHMEPDRFGATTVRNVYYDTPSLLLARRSAEHPYYKEKLRVRSYAPAGRDDQVYLELKKKCDGIVYKRRCEMSFCEADALLRGAREPQTQIERELAFSASRYEGLAPVVFVAYDREAFYAPDDHEFRMTFDRRVRCRWDVIGLDGPSDGYVLMPEGQSLLEVKCAAGMPLWLVDFLSAEGIYKGRFSKYGAAVNLMEASQQAGIVPVRLSLAPRTVVPASGARHMRRPVSRPQFSFA